MRHEELKLELIEWLTKLEDKETMEYLKIVKDAKSEKNDWQDDLSASEKSCVERGLSDIQNGRTISHDEVKGKYGL